MRQSRQAVILFFCTCYGFTLLQMIGPDRTREIHSLAWSGVYYDCKEKDKEVEERLQKETSLRNLSCTMVYLPGAQLEACTIPTHRNLVKTLSDFREDYPEFNGPIHALIYATEAFPRTRGFTNPYVRQGNRKVIFIRASDMKNHMVIRHELAHLHFLNLRGSNLPDGLNEGFAYFSGAQVDFKELHRVLAWMKEKGPLDSKTAFSLDRSRISSDMNSPESQRIYATGLATVFWLRTVQGLPLRGIVTLPTGELPNLTRTHLREIDFMLDFLHNFELCEYMTIRGERAELLLTMGPALPWFGSSRPYVREHVRLLGEVYSRHLRIHEGVSRWDEITMRRLSTEVERELWKDTVWQELPRYLAQVGFDSMVSSLAGFSGKDWEYLKTHGTIDPKNFFDPPQRPFTPEEIAHRRRQLRATGWALLYEGTVLDGAPLLDSMEKISKAGKIPSEILNRATRRIARYLAAENKL